jgi:hypothetical protein
MFGVDPNNLEAIQAAIKAGSEQQVSSLNADLIKRYKSAMADYNANVDSGQMSPVEGGVNYRPAPKVPAAWELAPANDDGFVFYQQGTAPVCDAIPVNPDKTQTQAQLNAAKPQGIVDIGQPIPTNPGWFTLGPHDTAPGGKSITMPDGHTYVKYTGFAPGTGWYLQVS